MSLFRPKKVATTEPARDPTHISRAGTVTIVGFLKKLVEVGADRGHASNKTFETDVKAKELKILLWVIAIRYG